MDEVVIPPANAGTTGFITKLGGHHGHHDHHRNCLETAPFFQSQAAALVAIEEGKVENAEGFGEMTTETVKQGLSGQLATQVGTATVALAVEKTAAAVNLAVEKTAAATSLAIQVSNAQILLDSSKNAAASLLDSAKNAAASALEANKNTNAILAAQAECCCELKELIRAENGQTRDLINANTAAALTVQLADAKSELLAIRIAGKIVV